MAHDRPGPADRRRRRLAAPVILACHLIALFLAVVERAAWRVAAAVWHLWTRARGRPPREFLGAWPPEPWPAPKTGLQRALGWVSSGVILATRLPLILVLDRVARRTALCAARAALAPLLATRSLVAGCGSLNFDAGVYELSQRAPFVRRHSGVRMPGSSRMLYHLKRHAIDPRHVFAPLQRLVIVCGDANLSDVPILLKAGTTCLILEMVEAGETFPELELADPVRALREASLGGPWKQLALRRGGTITALDVQKGYLARAKAFFANRLEGDRLRPRELLALWEECLDLVERHDPACAETFDWAAKRALLDAAILPKTTWKAFFAWGRALHQAGDEAVAAARDFPDLARRASWRGRWRLRRAMRGARLDPALFPAMRDLYLQARKIDLRFHELSPEGYQRTLEAQGLIRRIVTDEAIDQATRTPPADTRARIRSFYIRRSADPAYVFADWDELWLRHPPLHVDLADPFFARIPTDPWERPEA